MTKILIFGAGAVGCVYGYLLHRGGAEVVALCRSNYEAVKEKGILIRSRDWGQQQYSPVAVKSVSEASSHGPFDFVVVCSKAFPGTATLIREAVSPQTAIVLAQNGIDIEEDYVSLYPQNTIVSGVVYLPVTQVEPGVVEHGSFQRFEIGTYPAEASPAAKAQVQAFSGLFKAGGGSCSVFDDVQSVRWLKVAINISWNPVTALTLCDDANYLRSSSYAEPMARKMMREIGRIATAAGYPDVLTEEAIDESMQVLNDRLVTGGKEPSMLTDVRAGRPIEVEAILGNTLRIAQKHGLETPYLELLYTLAKGRDYSLAPDDRWQPIAKA